jgi:hypothetical protein
VNLRYPLDALFCECSVVNPGAVPCPLKGGIRQLLPPLAQVVDGVFFADFSGHVVRHEVKLSRLVSKASALYAVRRGQDVRVRVALRAFLAVWCMDCHVCGNAIGGRDPLRKFKGQGFALCYAEFNRQGYDELTCHLCICSFVLGFHGIPEFGTFWFPV